MADLQLVATLAKIQDDLVYVLEELLQPEFRRRATFGQTAQAALALRVAEAAEKRAELLGAFHESPLPAFGPPPGLPAQVATPDAIEAFADALRQAWRWTGIQSLVPLAFCRARVHLYCT